VSPRPTTPALTVDVIIETAGGVVLIERAHPPPGWALPGGFVDVGEPLARAARREAKEETGLDVELVEQFFAYSDPTRDARGHTVSVVFVGRVADGAQPVGADDAARAGVFALDALPPLAFDHATILDDYKRWRVTGRRPGVQR
jgi:8-oxo-dGTP diphosphatase